MKTLWINLLWILHHPLSYLKAYWIIWKCWRSYQRHNAIVEVDLSNLKLSFLPIGLRFLPKNLLIAPAFNLSNNQLKTLPKWFGEFNTYHLNISKNQFHTFPNAIFKFTDLEHFDISNNYLESIPSEIQALSKLKWLYLYNNNIKTLPNVFNKLFQLNTLVLSGNNLIELPKTIGTLAELYDLNLADNKQLKYLVDIPNCPKLQCLSIENTAISTLPNGIQNTAMATQIPEIYHDLLDAENIPHYLPQIGLSLSLENFNLSQQLYKSMSTKELIAYLIENRPNNDK